VSRHVEWMPGARADLLDQIAYLAAEGVDAADQILDRIVITGNALGDFATGRPGRITGTYEKSVRGLPYILVYALTAADRTVSIVRIIHTARDWQEGEWPE
jgi:toxin ParE1/3/4